MIREIFATKTTLLAVMLTMAALLGSTTAYGNTQVASAAKDATVPTSVASSRSHAKQANTDAVAEAAQVIILATKTDLDLRLNGLTSRVVASR